jgi:iron complex outermembrane receptor protein
MFNTKKSLATVVLMALPCMTFSQFNIAGKIKNKVSGELISGATIRLENTFIAAQSNPEGNFEIKNLKKGLYILQVSYLGFQHLSDTIDLIENKKIELLLSENTILIDEVIVQSTRADEKSAMSYSTIDKKQIAEQNLGTDLPYLLNQLPSVVTTSDAGAGVGYTGIHIRGVDATRINVTINGIPVNDAESQGTFWVDL